MAIYQNILAAAPVAPRYFGAPAAAGTNILIATPGAGHSICVTSFVIQSTGTVSANFEDSSGTDLGAAFTLQAREGINRQARAGDYLFCCAADRGLNLFLSGAIACEVEVEYVIA